MLVERDSGVPDNESWDGKIVNLEFQNSNRAANVGLTPGSDHSDFTIVSEFEFRALYSSPEIGQDCLSRTTLSYPRRIASMGIILIAQIAGYKPPRMPTTVLNAMLNPISPGPANRLTLSGQ